MARLVLPVTPENISLAAKIFVRQLCIRYSRNAHLSSAPYLSGDTFRAWAPHIMDFERTFDPDGVKERDVVFVHVGKVEDFFQGVHPHIRAHYILVLHNGDTQFSTKISAFIDEKIIRVYAQNVIVKHPKVVPLPIGLENASYANHGYIPYIRALQAEPIVRTRRCRILYGFSVHTNPAEREGALAIARKLPLGESVPSRLNTERYFQVLRQYMFVLSPPGNGEDCIRTWEAMYAGVVPIVKQSIAMEYFVSLGLPLWVVRSWDELKEYDEPRLMRQYRRIYERADTSALYANYWKYRIEHGI